MLLGEMDALNKGMIIRFTPYQTTTLPKWMFSQKLLFKSSLLLNSKCCIQVSSPNSCDNLCLFFCLYPSSLCNPCTLHSGQHNHLQCYTLQSACSMKRTTQCRRHCAFSSSIFVLFFIVARWLTSWRVSAPSSPRHRRRSATL